MVGDVTCSITERQRRKSSVPDESLLFYKIGTNKQITNESDDGSHQFAESDEVESFAESVM